ncbi:uncharacterized protein BJ171DRAFT_631935 [Polychytrium aggregatum]|uniref:uncharacterized protein n=1 Tax=Polychytrium aggregatum TaxID=110093 RepID=UPI0022FEB997|nr:uncharacterized protein BJ171DRAFT_631935 [Polychytrium aggregatum]KAI9199405.1 hypothetical protein BJ171DRAFT_631935 [Polychytrium aggregatum]
MCRCLSLCVAVQLARVQNVVQALKSARSTGMPPRTSYYFDYESDDVDSWECRMRCERCVVTKIDGRRCTRTTCIGVKYCYSHLATVKNLRIDDSTIPGAGKGLFAYKHVSASVYDDGERERLENAVLFKRGQVIIEYDGQPIPGQERQSRYGNTNAPYLVERRIGLNAGRYEDGACRRGIGTLANHSDDTNDVNAKLAQDRGVGVVLRALRDIHNGEEIFIDCGSAFGLDEEDAVFGTKRKTNTRERLARSRT